MEAIASYFLMLQKYINSKKNAQKKDYALHLANISKDFAVDNMKKQDLKEL